MKKVFAVMMVALCALALFANGTQEQVAPKAVDYSSYTIRVYSNSNDTARASWLIAEAEKAGFKISFDDNTVISGDTGVAQAANENKDGDIIFGMNEIRWTQLINGVYENVKIMDYTPSWGKNCGTFKFDNKAYGLVIQNVFLFYRTDLVKEDLHFQHWADITECGYTWYRQGKVGGSTNGTINKSLLFPYVDPSSPAGGISVDGWKKLWKYCAEGKFTGDSYGFEPLNKAEVQVSSFFSSSLYGSIDNAASSSKNPLTADNWKLVDIDDGTYYIAEYVGIVDKAGRTAEQTEIVKAFVEWFGGKEFQAKWANEWDTYPCNSESAKAVYGDNIPSIYTTKNFALTEIPGTGLTYVAYCAAHDAEWTNIMTNLGFYWADASKAVAEPNWDTLDWATLTRKK